MVVWIVGMSGVGKSTLAGEVARLVREKGGTVAVLDGDVMREVWGDNPGHDLEGRRKNAGRLHRLSRYLDQQGIHVVAPVLSIFQETRDANRQELQDYYEVYIRSPKDALMAHDPKGLYARAAQGEIQLPGVNMLFEEPVSPDIVIENNDSLADLLAVAPALANRILCANYPYARRDLLREPENYFYAPFGGGEFVEAWKRSRLNKFAAWTSEGKEANLPQDLTETERVLWRLATEGGPVSDQDNQLIEGLLRRFEISKKLPAELHPPRYSCQSVKECLMRPHAYAFFGAILAQQGAIETDLRKLNCLLKINDLLCSLPSLPSCVLPFARRSVEGELAAVNKQIQRSRQ